MAKFADVHAPIARTREDRFQLLAGHHRLAAAVKAGLDVIPCWVEDLNDEAAFMLLPRWR